jgi:hypothetical protein
VYTELWRDNVILPALRIYRSRTEGASLDTVPETTYSQKPSCDGRADKSKGQRGIIGFEPAQARRGYIYNPDRNPNLLDMPPANQDDKALLTSWDKGADICNGALEDEYFEAFKAYISASGTKRRLKPRSYAFTSVRFARFRNGGTSARRPLSPRSGKARRLGRL